MVVLGFEVIDRRGVTAKEFRAAAKETLGEAAVYFGEKHLPRRFRRGNKSRYQMESRRRFYMQEIKPEAGVGRGKTVLLSLSGRSERAALLLNRISLTSKSATIAMPMPNYFTNPKIGLVVDPKTGRRSRITRQPDKVGELKFTPEDGKRGIRNAQRAALVEKLNAVRNPPRKYRYPARIAVA